MLLSVCKVVFYYLLTYISGFCCLFTQLFTERQKHLSEIPLQTGKVAIVTGGSGGIGFYVAKGLVTKNVHVIIGGKCKEAGGRAIKEIRKDFPNAKVDFIHLDLASLESVRNFSEDFLARDLKLNILINNAGIMFTDYDLTIDGLESQFQVNYLGHFYLTQLLLDSLRKSGRENQWSRVVNVSSYVHYLGAPTIDNLDKRKAHWLEYSSHKAYADSKLLIIASSNQLHGQLRDDQAFVSVCSLHPGVVWSDLWKNIKIWIHRYPLLLIQKLFLSPEQGAETILYAAMSPEVEGQSGCYYDNCEPCDAAAMTYDLDFQCKLWAKTMDILSTIKQKHD